MHREATVSSSSLYHHHIASFVIAKLRRSLRNAAPPDDVCLALAASEDNLERPEGRQKKTGEAPVHTNSTEVVEVSSSPALKADIIFGADDHLVI
jgi:hypothetical protein